MLNLVQAVFYLVELLGTPPEENVIRDRRGLEALQRFGSDKMQAAIASAKTTLLEMLRTGSLPLTGKCQGEPSRRGVTVLELQDYYIDIGASEMSSPPRGTAADFPKITGLRINEAELMQKAAKVVPKIRANRVAACLKWLTQMRRDTENRPPVRAILKKQAHEQFGVGEGQFRSIAKVAAKQQPNRLWGLPGRPPQK